jgi:hypothetical protein
MTVRQGRLFSAGTAMQRYLQSDSNGGTTFDPDTVHLLGDALDGAWRRLQTTGVYFESRGHAEATREKLALRIIEMAKQGERDLDRLRDDALEHLERTSPERSKRRYTGL